MRHNVFGRKLNRNSAQRKALFKSLLVAMVKEGKIKTSVSKAKAIRPSAEKLVTLAKTNTNATVNRLNSILNNKELVRKLISEIAPTFKNRPGGYTKMTRLGKRAGDATEEVIFQWTEAPVKPAPVEKKEKKKVEKKTPVKKEKKSDKTKEGNNEHCEKHYQGRKYT